MASGGVVMSRLASVSFLGCVLLCGAGCSSVSIGPPRIHPVEVEAVALSGYEFPVAPDVVPLPHTDALANYVTERMYEIDLEYGIYFAKLTNEYQAGSVAGDLAILGLTAGSTLAPAVVTKTILSATSTAVTGAKAAVDKDVLLSNTIQILQNTMETNRGQIRNSILSNLNNRSLNYTYWQALSDLENYYRAGTVPGALEALQAATGSAAQNVKSCATGVTPDSTGVNCSPTGSPTGGTGAQGHAPAAGVPHVAVRGVNSHGSVVPSLR